MRSPLSALLAIISRTCILRDRLLRRVPIHLPPSTPTAGIKRLQLKSHSNTLDAVLVQPLQLIPKHSVLICHGIGETVEHWSAVQLLLAEQHIASLVFDYSGYGRSTGHITPEQCEHDAMIAFVALQRCFPETSISLLGFSMGSGIAAAIHQAVPTRTLILCASFTTFREAAVRMGLPPPLRFLVPDIWRTSEFLRHTSVPILIVHGERDRLFPPSMAQALACACAARCETLVLPNVTHNAPMARPTLSYWQHIISRL